MTRDPAMMDGRAVATGGPRPLRPDLPVPLLPTSAVGAAVRYGLTLLRAPAFGRARQQTMWWATAAVLLVVAGLLRIAPDIREIATIVGVTLALYAALRTIALRILERRQLVFESGWLAERSAELRARTFKVVRCTVNGHAYDLTDPNAVRELLDAT